MLRAAPNAVAPSVDACLSMGHIATSLTMRRPFASLPEIVMKNALEDPTRPAVMIVTGAEASFESNREKLASDMCSWAQGFWQQGIRARDPVLVAMEHDYDLIVTVLALMRIGAHPAILPYYDPSRSSERATKLRHHVRELGIRALTTTARLFADHAEMLRDTGCRPLLPGPGEKKETAEYEIPVLHGPELAYLQFTTGTTGPAKAARVTHQAAMANARCCIRRLRLGKSDALLGWAPFSHPMALSLNLWMPLVSGALSITIPPKRWLRDPVLLLQVAGQRRVTTVAMPNFGYRHSVERVSDAVLPSIDLSSVRTMLNSSEPVIWRIMESFQARFGPCGLRSGALRAVYGMSEYTGAITIAGESAAQVDWVDVSELRNGVATPRSNGRPIVGCGRVLDETEVRIVDANGLDLPDRRVGEILIRGAALFDGYEGRPDLTAESMIDGWFRTGDEGYSLDQELFLCGRRKDIIIVAGRKISPESIEQIAMSVLRDVTHGVVAFGVFDEALSTELPVLVCETPANVTGEALHDYANTIRKQVNAEVQVALGRVHFVSRGWIIYRDLKLARSSCRDKYEAETVPNVVLPQVAAGALRERLTAVFEKTLGISPIALNDNFFEVGGDSLAAARLVAAIEKELGLVVPMRFYEEPTVNALARAIEGESLPPATQPKTAEVESKPATPPPAHPPAPARADLVKLMRGNLEDLAFRFGYRRGIRLLRLWCRNPVVQNVLYRREVEELRVAYRDMNGQSPLRRQAIAASLMGNIILDHRTRRQRIPLYPSSSVRPEIRRQFWKDVSRLIDHSGQGSLVPYTKIIGREHLTAALASGAPIVLATHHHTGAHFSFAMIRYLIPRELLFLGATEARNLQHTARPWASRHEFEMRKQPWFAALAVRAKEVLAKGGAVVVAIEYRIDDQNCVTLPVARRARPMKTGFAELALDCSATVLPVTGSMSLDGNLQIEFARPLDSPSPSQPRATQVDHLVRQAGAFLERSWTLRPESMRWREINDHVQLPAA